MVCSIITNEVDGAMVRLRRPSPDCSPHHRWCLVRQEGLQLLKREESLASLLQPDYVWIFKQLGRTEGGVKFLVDMRAHLLVGEDLARA